MCAWINVISRWAILGVVAFIHGAGCVSMAAVQDVWPATSVAGIVAVLALHDYRWLTTPYPHTDHHHYHHHNSEPGDNVTTENAAKDLRVQRGPNWKWRDQVGSEGQWCFGFEICYGRGGEGRGSCRVAR